MDPDDLRQIAARLSWLENRSYGARAVYMGEGRVLTQSNFHGLMYLVDASDHVIVPHFIMDGVFETDVTLFFLRNIRPDSRCVDVGANFGYYTCMMARLAPQGQTIGIEVDPRMFEFLRENVVLNWLGNATALNLAVSDSDKELTFYRRKNRSSNTGIIHLDNDDGSAAERFTIKSSALDNIISYAVDFMKVDVEGAETLVFRGARGLIAQNPGIQIVMEWAPDQMKAAGFSPAELTDELAALDLVPNIMQHDGNQISCAWADVRTKDLCNILMRRSAP